MAIHELTDKEIREMVAAERSAADGGGWISEYAKSDGGGLVLVVRLRKGSTTIPPEVDRYWTFSYTSPEFAGERRKIGLGPHPDLTLAWTRRWV